MTDKILNILSAFKGDFDNISVLISSVQSKSVILEGLEVESVDVSSDTRVSLRAVKGGRQISGGFSGGEPDTINDFLSANKSIINRLPPDEFRYIPEYSRSEECITVDKSFYEIDVNTLIDTAKALTKAAFKTDSRVKSVKQAIASAELIDRQILSTAGPLLKSKKTVFSAGTYLIAEEKGEERDGFDQSISTKFSELNADTVGMNSAVRACLLLNAKAVRTGKYKILFTADVMSEFIELLLDLVNGENVFKGVSMLGGKLGAKVASSGFTLIDDPTVSGGLGTRSFDDEGQKCEKIDIFKDGTLKSYLHNNYTSKALGQTNNARAVVSVTGNISAGCTNVSLLSTTDKAYPNEDCMIITEVMGMHTADPVSGEFSVGVSGIVFEDNEKKYPFREAVLSGNLADLMNGMIDVYSNRKSIGNMSVASVLFESMTLSGV